MYTTNDFLDLIKSDEDIQKIIRENEELKKNHKPRTRRWNAKKINTSSGIALKYFWSSIDGSRFRMILENKYKVNISCTATRGKIKDALGLYLMGVIGNERKRY